MGTTIITPPSNKDTKYKGEIKNRRNEISHSVTNDTHLADKAHQSIDREAERSWNRR